MPEKLILVVDDDPTILDLVCEFLEDEGYAVEQASNGAEALIFLDRAWPDLIILDVWMPVLNGLEFAKVLQARGLKPRILVMSAAGHAQTYAKEIGADDYIAKPFQLTKLLAGVERLVNGL